MSNQAMSTQWFREYRFFLERYNQRLLFLRTAQLMLLSTQHVSPDTVQAGQLHWYVDNSTHTETERIRKGLPPVLTVVYIPP